MLSVSVPHTHTHTCWCGVLSMSRLMFVEMISSTFAATFAVIKGPTDCVSYIFTVLS